MPGPWVSAVGPGPGFKALGLGRPGPGPARALHTPGYPWRGIIGWSHHRVRWNTSWSEQQLLGIATLATTSTLLDADASLCSTIAKAENKFWLATLAILIGRKVSKSQEIPLLPCSPQQRIFHWLSLLPQERSFKNTWEKILGS